jgi:uncharacterized repeat protein (TIGR03803 family)
MRRRATYVLRRHHWLCLLAIGVLAVFLAPSAASGAAASPNSAVETVLHRFGGPLGHGRGQDGKWPASGLTVGPNGDLFGISYEGHEQCGVVFEVSPNGVEKPIYTFTCGADGGVPSRSTPLIDASGALYGTAVTGGTDSAGVVWKLTPTRSGYSESVLYSFTAFSDDGMTPEGPVVMDSSGDLYGTTSEGGGTNSGGTVFKLTPSDSGYTESILHRFAGGDDGSEPFDGVLVGPDGVLYGATAREGQNGTGTIFRLTPNGSGYAYAILHQFGQYWAGSTDPAGAYTQTPLSWDDGELLGAAEFGGPSGQGLIFKINPDTGTLTTLYNFQGGRDGADPQGPLTLDAAGDIFGATTSGGDAFCGGYPGCGTVFELQHQSDGSYAESVLYTFPSPPTPSSKPSISDGNTPQFGVALANGSLYGTTRWGGYDSCDDDGGCGVLFELSVPGLFEEEAAQRPLVVTPDSTLQLPDDSGVRLHTNDLLLTTPALSRQGFSGKAPSGETPATIYPAYGLSYSPTAGSGVIAIVDAFDYPTAEHDLGVFSQQFSLPACTTANGCFNTVYASGSRPKQNCGWNEEAALDIEWAHAMAPGAKIVLVETASNGLGDLIKGVEAASTYIQNHGGKGEVSMSWGGDEFVAEQLYNYLFTPPSGTSIVYVASSGDSGGVTEWPSVSPNVVAAGGTTLNRDASGNFVSETGWSDSGGGPSYLEAKPPYQVGIPNTGDTRSVPDLSFDANPKTGVSVYEGRACQLVLTPDQQGAVVVKGWLTLGGTSVAAPSLAGIINSAGGFAPNSGSELTTIYSQFNSSTGGFGPNFRDILSGQAGGYSAGPGWDFVTGVGSSIGLSGK